MGKLSADRENALKDCQKCLDEVNRQRREVEVVRADAETELKELKRKLDNKRDKYRRTKQELKKQIEEKYTIAGQLQQIEL